MCGGARWGDNTAFKRLDLATNSVSPLDRVGRVGRVGSGRATLSAEI